MGNLGSALSFLPIAPLPQKKAKMGQGRGVPADATRNEVDNATKPSICPRFPSICGFAIYIHHDNEVIMVNITGL